MALPTRPDWHLPPWLHLPRLEAVLGCSLANLDWSTLKRLIDDKVREDLSIDYKAQSYEPGEQGSFELAKDVAAFANASGGLVIIGIGDQRGEPSGFSHFAPTDAHRRHLMTVITERIAPFVQDLQIGMIGAPVIEPSEDETDDTAASHQSNDEAIDEAGAAASASTPSRPAQDGCLLLLIPSSDLAPHAVMSKATAGPRQSHAMSWPVREVSQTRWLREPELATRYRDRFTASVDVTSRLRSAFADALLGIDRTDEVWLAVGLAPARPAPRRPLSAALRDEVKEAMKPDGSQMIPTFSSQASYGRGRIILSDRFGQASLSGDHHLELHTDGTAFAALRMRTEQPYEVANRTVLLLPPGPIGCVNAWDISAWLLGLFGLCAKHAVSMGAAGEFELTAQILNALERDELGLEVPMPAVEDRRAYPLVLTEYYGSGGGAIRMVHGSVSVAATTPTHVTSSASIASSERELAAACAQLSNEIFAEFGQLPASPLLGLDGSVSAEATSYRFAERLQMWAKSAGLLEQFGSDAWKGRANQP